MQAGRGASNTRSDDAGTTAAHHSAAGLQSLGARIQTSLHDASSALVAALGIAICAAAPELIWRGIKIALAHASWADLVSTLLIAVIVAFFVEPILEHTRTVLHWSKASHAAEQRPGALFKAVVSMVFAVTSVTIHDAMIAFVSNSDLDGATDGSPLSAAVELVVEWAMVPFAVAIAWQTMRSRWLSLPLGVVAASSSLLGGWLFEWSRPTVIATTIPCLVIQYFGYRQINARYAHRGYVPHAMVVAGTAIVWFICASLFDVSASRFDFGSMRLYDAPRLLIDMRFYFGWAVGLLLASPVRRERKRSSP